MAGSAAQLYRDIAERTGGDIYLGVVGPVRTGKSTFVKRVMETLVIPNIENIYQKERAKDELPQSGSGRTIMTSEPKFVPEDAVEISPDGTAAFSIRLIDSVGYMIPGALGAEEEGKPRLVTTPWFPEPIPMTQAAELGTKKIMDEHCSIGIVMTTDGSIHDIPRADFEEAENRAIEDMKATGKPFLVLINSADPAGEAAKALQAQLEVQHQVHALCINCLTMQEQELREILSAVLYEFPVTELQFYLPAWLDVLPFQHEVKATLYEAMRQNAAHIARLSEAEPSLSELCKLEEVETFRIRSLDPGTGVVVCELGLPERLFYQILTERSGFQVENDGDLVRLLAELSKIKKEYDKVSSALAEVQATGYGIVKPTPDEMQLEVPQIVRKGSNYGVRLKASAPSIHMMRADIETEINPMVGDEKQSEDLLQYLLQEYEGDTEKLWESNIFGKSVYELVNEGLGTKLKRMPEESRYKLQSTLSRIINEGSSGLLCIILS